MTVFRNRRITRFFTLITGVVFLNMGFFLAEVRMLNLQDRKMIENVCKLVLNGGLEEERESSTSGADVPLEIFSMGSQLLMRHSSLFLIAARMHRDSEDSYLHADHSETFSPPPELVSFFS